MKLDYLYHATPFANLDSILSTGITANNPQNRAAERPYACYSPSMRRALYFARWVQCGFNPNILIGIIRIDPEKLSKDIKEGFKSDPSSAGSLKNEMPVPSSSFDFVLLVDVSKKDETAVERAQLLEQKFGLPVNPLEYDESTSEFSYKKKFYGKKVLIELA